MHIMEQLDRHFNVWSNLLKKKKHPKSFPLLISATNPLCWDIALAIQRETRERCGFKSNQQGKGAKLFTFTFSHYLLILQSCRQQHHCVIMWNSLFKCLKFVILLYPHQKHSYLLFLFVSFTRFCNPANTDISLFHFQNTTFTLFKGIFTALTGSW